MNLGGVVFLLSFLVVEQARAKCCNLEHRSGIQMFELTFRYLIVGAQPRSDTSPNNKAVRGTKPTTNARKSGESLAFSRLTCKV